MKLSMDLNVERVGLLLLIAAVVAMLTRRVHLPYSVGLVAAGIFFALLPFSPETHFTKELLFAVLLPPLIFEAALSIEWKQLRKDFALIVVLATAGVVLSDRDNVWHALPRGLAVDGILHFWDLDCRYRSRFSRNLQRGSSNGTLAAAGGKRKLCSMMELRQSHLQSRWS